jgi:hypothetical protein
MIARHHEAAGAGFGVDFGRDRAHPGRQNRGEITCGIHLDQARFLDRLAAREGSAHHIAGQLFDGVGTVVLADGARARGGGRPHLPAHFLGLQRGACAQILARDQDVDGLKLDDGFRRRSRLVPGTAGQQSGETAGCHRNSQHHKTRGFHYASLSTNDATGRYVAVTVSFTIQTSIRG